MVLTLVLGVVVTLATSLFKAVQFSSRTKHLIALVLSAVAAAVAVAIDGGTLDVANITATGTTMYAISQVVYQFILRGTKLNVKLEDIEILAKNVAASTKKAKKA